MDSRVTKLVDYIRSLNGFVFIDEIDAYKHMGAVVVDGILQAGLNYKTVVKPRVEKVLRRFSKQETTSEFLEICKRQNLKEIIDWNDDRKPKYIIHLLEFLRDNKIETTVQLRAWLEDEQNFDKFVKENNGVGSVTGEYFRILTGAESVKIDRHVKKFLRNAGLDNISTDDAVKVVKGAASVFGVKSSVLDYSIYRYQSSHNT